MKTEKAMPATSMTTAGPWDSDPDRQRGQHRVHQETHRPQPAAHGGEQREAPHLLRQDIVGQPVRQPARVPRAGRGCRLAGRDDSFLFRHGRMVRSSQLPIGVCGLRALFQFLQVQQNRLVRAQQVVENLLARPRLRRSGARIFEIRPQARANRRRQDPLQVLQRRPAQVLIVGLQTAKSNQQRLGRQDQRQQREDVRQAPARPVLHDIVEEVRAEIVDLMKQPLAVPHRPADGRLPLDHLENPLPVDANAGILLEQLRQRACAVVPHLEAQVVEAEQQAVGRPLGRADREHAGQSPPDDERLVRVDERVGQLADPFFRHLPQRDHRLLRHGVPREQRNQVWHERGRHAVVGAKHLENPLRIARTESGNLCDVGVQVGGWGAARAVDMGSAPGRT